MPPDPLPIAYIALLCLLAAFCAVCMLFVYALSHISPAKLRKLTGKDQKKAKRILADEPRFLYDSLCALWWLALAALTGAVVLCKTAGLPWALLNGFSLPLSQGLVHLLSGALWVLAFAAVFLVLCVLVPCRVASSAPEKTLLAVYPFMRTLAALATPVVRPLYALLQLRQAQKADTPDDEDDNLAEEEIMFLVDAGGEDGSIEQSERDMIENVFEFDDRTAGEVMTHRTQVVALPQSTPLAQVLTTATQEGYSRIPVYENDIDDIRGVLYVKDLLPLINHPVQNFSLKDYIRPALFVPESNRCRELFNEFKAKKLQLAIVVDEYGGTFGIVTMEDLLESIVGNIQDEYDDEEEQAIQKVNDNLYYIDGATPLDEISKVLRVDFEENPSYDTLAGLVSDLLGRIPDDHEHAVASQGELRFTVLEVADRRINLVKVERLPPQSQAGNATPAPAE